MPKSNEVMQQWKWTSRKFISSWLLQTAVFHPDLLKARDVVRTRKDKPTKDLDYLKAKNCDPIALRDILGLVCRLKDFVPDIRPRKLDQAADHVQKALAAMLTVVPSSPYTVNEDRLRIIKGTGGILHVTPEQAEHLVNISNEYELYATWIRRGFWPRRDRLEGICNLLPVVYVKKRSGQPYFERVARLLDWVRVNTTARALASDYKDAAQLSLPQFPDACLLWLEFLLEMIEIEWKEATATGSQRCANPGETPIGPEGQNRRRREGEPR